MTVWFEVLPYSHGLLPPSSNQRKCAKDTFFYLTKTFNTVNYDTFWKLLKKRGFPYKVLNDIISFYEMMKAAVVS